MRFMLPNYRIMPNVCAIQNISDAKDITHADPDHLFLAVTQYWSRMRLCAIGFPTLKSHIAPFHLLQMRHIVISRDVMRHSFPTL